MTLSLLCGLLALSSIATSKTDLRVQPAKFTKLTARAEVGDITGYYTCKGKEASGKSYSGIAVVSRKNDIYIVKWVVGSGSTFVGIGIRQGDTLATSWAIPGDKGVVRGINIYNIEPGPRLVGRWASLPGPGVVQSEVLNFLKPLEDDE